MRADALQAVIQRRLTLESAAYEMNVVQQPADGRALSSPRRNARGAVKWPLDPPCVVEMKLRDNDPSEAYLHSPYWLCTVGIEPQENVPVKSDTLTGSLSSSLHKVKLQQDTKDHGFFVFAELYVKYAGVFRLKFTLYEMRQGPANMVATQLNWVYSKPFEIQSSKVPSPLRESTMLSKSLSDAGVKLRIRKEAAKRKASQYDWSATAPLDQIGALAGIAPAAAVISPPGRGHHRTPMYVEGGEPVSHRLSYRRPGALGLRDALNREYGSAEAVTLGYPPTMTLPLPASQPGSSQHIWSTTLQDPYQMQGPGMVSNPNMLAPTPWSGASYHNQQPPMLPQGTFLMNSEGTNATHGSNGTNRIHETRQSMFPHRDFPTISDETNGVHETMQPMLAQSFFSVNPAGTNGTRHGTDGIDEINRPHETQDAKPSVFPHSYFSIPSNETYRPNGTNGTLAPNDMNGTTSPYDWSLGPRHL